MRFTIPIKSVAKGRPRMTRRGICYTPAKTVQFERAVKLLTLPYKPKKPLICGVSIIIIFSFKKPKTSKLKSPSPDIDNLLKAVLDAIQGENGFILNDKQVIELHGYKYWGEDDSIDMEIEPTYGK